MASFQFDVDTRPMAESVNSSRNHINGVSVAVTTMQAAVIAAEKNASKTICENVDTGFFMLIKSQISQKSVAAYTAMSSKHVILLQLSKALEKVKRQMESDYNMITRRYTKLFQSLDKQLEIRVKELDRPAMQLADIKKNIVFDKFKDDSSMLFSVSEETTSLIQTALTGKLKTKTRDTLATLLESIDENESYSDKVEAILLKNEDGNAGDSMSCLPAAFFVSESLLNSSEYLENVYTSDILKNKALVVSEINRVQNDFSWTDVQESEKQAIKKEFIALCEDEVKDDRLSKEIVRLFEESNWEVLK